MRMVRIYVLAAVLLLALAASSFGQLAAEGTPPSFGQKMSYQADAAIMDRVDVAAYLAEDDKEEQEGLPFRFGAPFDVDYRLNNSGTWERLADGSGVWRLRIQSKDAHSINLIYDDFYLPPGAELYVYSQDREMVRGAFTSQNNKESGLFATAPVKGDDITVEYYEPFDVRGQGHFTITRIVHAYKDLFGYTSPDKAYGSSGSCNVNVNCPEGDDWQLEKRSVAMVLLGNGTRWCSGAMVNNVREDETPYFLTANHCLNGEENWIIMFRYESSGCTNQDGPTNYTIHGTTLRATNTYSDFALVELSETPPASYDIYYSGWSNVDVAASNAIGIHHPSGDVKKISFENAPVTSAAYLQTSGVSHWRVADWDVGTTEGGSSGSPLFDPSHRIIGQLHGGYAACTNNDADWYGKVSDSWDYGSSSSNRLRDWLDPDNTGANTLNGYDPFSSPAPNANFTATPTTGEVSLTVNFTDQSTNSPTSWSWNFGDGGTSSAQNPSHTYTSAGIYTVTLTATNSYGSDDEVKTGYITVTGPQAYASVPYSTGFETGSFDQYWTATSDAEGRIEISSANTPRGSYHVVMDDHTDGGSYSTNAVELFVDLAGQGDVDLSFYWKEFSDEDHTQDGVFFSDDAGTNYTKVYDLTGGSTSYAQVNLDVDQLAASNGLSLTGTFVIKFQQYDNYAAATDGIAIDDVSLSSSVPAPVAAFSGTPTSGCAPLAVSFTDASTGDITGYSWTFGDGGTSTAQNPSHSYTAAGMYTVVLTVSGPGGSDGETKTNYVTVTTAPTAGFAGSPTSGTEPLTVTFTDQSTGGATGWNWTFGDGGTSTAQNPSHTYNTAGTYTVTLTASNGCGSDGETRTGYISVGSCLAPVAAFTGSPTSGDYDLTVNFTDQSTNSPAGWSWNFGDGGTSTAQSPSHTYTAAGTYTVSLTATNACGSDGETKTDYITVTEPSGSWTVITYDDFESGMGNYTDGGTDMLLYTGGSYAHQGSNAADIQDNSSTSSSFYHTGSYNVSGYDELEVEFWFYAVSMDNSAEDFWVQYYDGSAWQTVATYARATDFENGVFYNKVVSIPKGTYTYPSDAKLRFMCDASGDRDDVYIDEVEFRGYGSGGPMAPTAAFAGTPTSGNYPLTVNFTDQSVGDVTSWSWTFGDGGTSTSQNPSHVYNSVGTYTVALTATGPGGSDDETKTGYITVTEPGVGGWTTITYDDFESGFGNYTDGGGDCYLYTSGTRAHQGSNAAGIQDNSGTASSFYHTSSYNVSGYDDLEIEFWFYAYSMDNTKEDFWVQYYDGSTWQTVETYARTTDFDNNVFYNKVVTIPKGTYTYSSNAQIRFMCDASGNADDVYIDELEFRGYNAAAKSAPLVPTEFALSQNYPNPFNPSTVISFALPHTSHVTLDICNILGQRVTVLTDQQLPAGQHEVVWNASEYSSGVYFYRIRTDKNTATKKMLLVK